MIKNIFRTTLLFLSLFTHRVHAQTNIALGKPVTYSTGTGKGAALADGDFATNFQTSNTLGPPNAEWI